MTGGFILDLTQNGREASSWVAGKPGRGMPTGVKIKGKQRIPSSPTPPRRDDYLIGAGSRQTWPACASKSSAATGPQVFAE